MYAATLGVASSRRFIEEFAPIIAKFVLNFFPALHHLIAIVFGFLTSIPPDERFLLTYLEV
jgi:hypothetical protein